MCEWGSAAVTIILASMGAFFSLLLAWYSQQQQLNIMSGRLAEAEKGEKECLERDRKNAVEISDLKAKVKELELRVK